jgi:hypothetical protein
MIQIKFPAEMRSGEKARKSPPGNDAIAAPGQVSIARVGADPHRVLRDE